MTIPKPKLRQITKDYLKLLKADWAIYEVGSVYRRNGPVLQGICFDRSRTDDYFPQSFFKVLAEPGDFKGGMEMVEWLRKPNQSPWYVSLQSHAKFQGDVAQAMVAQFKPPIDKPLHWEDVLQLYESRKTSSFNETFSFITLLSYAGKVIQAEQSIVVFRRMFDDLVAHKIATEGVYELGWFVDKLEAWNKEGTARQNLDRVVEEQVRKFDIK
jgi:hypothetical protein